MVNNTKIIFIITYSPRYDEYANQPKPKWYWDKPDGSFVGIWGYEWGDMLGKAITEYYDLIEFEVWQMDTRADKVYSAKLRDKVIHRNFPSCNKTKINGLKTSEYLYSKKLIEYARAYNKSNVVLIFPSTVISPFKSDLFKAMNKARIIQYNFLNAKLMFPGIEKTLNPFQLIHRSFLSLAKKRNLNSMKNLLTSFDNPVILEKIKANYPHINIFRFKTGLDFDFWKKDISNEEARKKLKIPEKKFVLFLSQRLVPEYQIDRFIKIVSEIRTSREFVCYISGHGSMEYENYLNELASNYNVQDKINFIGYVSDDELKKYFIACDVFVTVPIAFAGSMGAKKAMAVGKPIIHVTSGSTFEFLKERNAGLFLEPDNYKQWTKEIKEVIEGKPVRVVPVREVVEYYAWSTTAKEIIYAVENSK